MIAKKEVKGFYCDYSTFYDGVWNSGKDQFGVDVVQLLDLQKNDAVLDIGCGTGRFLTEVSKRVKEVYGIDFSEKMLEKAKEKCKNNLNIRLIRQDILTKLPFKDDFFDKILCILVSDHI